MKILLTFAFVVLCTAQFSSAYTIQQVIESINLEVELLEQTIKTSNSLILEDIAATRADLNENADELRAIIKNGAEECQSWTAQVDQAQGFFINSVIYFQRCEMLQRFTELYRKKLPLSDLLIKAKQLVVSCANPSESCTEEIDILANQVIEMHKIIEEENADILKASAACVRGSSQDLKNMLNRFHSFWLECLSAKL